MKKNTRTRGILPHLGKRLGRWALCLSLCCFSVYVSMAQSAPTVTLNCQGETLVKAIEELRQQTHYNFLFNSDELRGYNTGSVSLENVSLAGALDKLLAGKGLTYSIDKHNVVIRKQAAAPATPVRLVGKVTDEKGQPLPGVTVMIKGTGMGGVTDVEGNYALDLPDAEDVRLLFSFIGMKTQEVAYTGQKEVNVTMREENTQMDEVVVTGYQVVDRRKNTSAVTSVKAEDIMIPGMTTIDKMLEGQIPDLMVMTNSGESGVASRIRIRGTSTLIGNREPLWVIDGVIVQDPVQISPDELNDPDYINRIGNAISGLNPQDIDRIDVLKDASATALYGTKAANGVIVITTKRGHIGEPQISYSGTGTLKLRPRYSDRKIDLMSAKERLNVSRELAEAGYEYASNVTWVGYEKLLRDFYNRQITYDEFQKQVAYLGDMNTDWFKLLTRDAFSSQHTLSVTGGTDKVRYYSSVGVNLEDDVVKPNSDRRYTATLNLDMNFTPWFAASFNMNGNTSKRKYYQEEIAPINYAYNTSRAIPAYDENGNYSFYQKSDRYNYNILNELDNSSKRQESSAVTMRANVDIKPWNWLKIGAILSYSINNTDIEGYWGEKSYHAAVIRRANYGAHIDNTSVMPVGGELTKEEMRTKTYMFRLQGDFNKYFGTDDQHNINASVGMETNSSKYDAYKNVSRGYDPDRGKQFITVQQGVYTSYESWLRENAPTITDNLNNMLSWYGSVSYSFRNLFTINGNMRYDGSNKFGEQSNDKLLPIWSASFNYNVAEHFKGDQEWFEDLRVKASWGYQGNMLDNQSPVLIIAKQPLSSHFGEYVSTIDIYPNPALKWEKTSSLNLGVEFSMFSRRLMVEASYYRKKTQDAYMNKEISGVNGMRSYVVNGGEIINSGYDVSLTVSPIKTKDLRWYISTSFSHANNEVNSSPAAEQYEKENFLNGTALVNGESISSFYSYKFLGLNPEDGTPMFDTMEEERESLYGATKYDVFTKVLEISGRREPKIFGGLSTTVNYKRWRLNAAFSYSVGAKTRLFRLYDNNYARIRPESNLNRTFLNRWQHAGDERLTDIPVLLPDGTNGNLNHWSGSTSGKVPEIANTSWEMYNYSNHRVVSANYLKCTNIGLTYSFDAERLKLQRLELSLSTSNPFVWSAKALKGQTPVQSGFTDIQLSERPTYTIGLNITF